MNKKEWILIIIVMIAIGFVGTMFVLSGQPFTPQGLITFAVTGGLALITSIIAFVTTQWQLLIGTISGITAVVGTTYKLISNKFNSTKQDLTSQLQDERAIQVQQYKDFQEQIQGQESTIQKQTIQIKELQTKVDSNIYNEQYIKQVEGQLQSQTTELNTLRHVSDPDYVAALERTITEHKLPLPVKEANIQLVTVVR